VGRAIRGSGPRNSNVFRRLLSLRQSSENSSDSTNINTSTSEVIDVTGAQSSQVPSNVYGNAAITTVGQGTPAVATTGQGTNSSYYGQVTDHGKTSSQPPSPVQLRSSLPITTAQVVDSTSVSQFSTVQSAYQCNFRVKFLTDLRMVLDREEGIIASRKLTMYNWSLYYVR
jgi:hypothetical protein